MSCQILCRRITPFWFVSVSLNLLHEAGHWLWYIAREIQQTGEIPTIKEECQHNFTEISVYYFRQFRCGRMHVFAFVGSAVTRRLKMVTSRFVETILFLVVPLQVTQCSSRCVWFFVLPSTDVESITRGFFVKIPCTNRDFSYHQTKFVHSDLSISLHKTTNIINRAEAKTWRACLGWALFCSETRPSLKPPEPFQN